MFRYDSYGKSKEAIDLIPGQFYAARFLGVNNGADVSPADEDYKPYKAVKTGSLFVFRRATSLNSDGTIGKCSWYHVPELFNVHHKLTEAEVIEHLQKSN